MRDLRKLKVLVKIPFNNEMPNQIIISKRGTINMAYSCFTKHLIQRAEVWGHKFDFNFVEENRMNNIDWINYVTTTP
jgi:hypothetical protein